MTIRGFILAAVLLLGASLSCSLSLDLDKREGHPCTAKNECLPGYRCAEGVCLPTEGRGKLCEPECAGGQGCDLRAGTCTDPCSASVCPTGSTCSGGGACTETATGLGAPCVSDAECEGAIPACSGDVTSPATLLCACMRPVGGSGGICLAMPRLAEDCAACPEGSSCIEASFSRAGQNTLCVPGGFRACAGAVDCLDEDPDVAMHCGYLGWTSDPLWDGTDTGLGLLAACVSPTSGAVAQVGEICDPAAPIPCASGLCVMTVGGGHLCSAACGRDAGCQGIGVGRCVEASLPVTIGRTAVTTTAKVCGSAPTLGASCEASDGGADVCGTDAPLCRIRPGDTARLCTRSCRTDADCPGDQGFVCNPDGFTCF